MNKIAEDFKRKIEQNGGIKHIAEAEIISKSDFARRENSKNEQIRQVDSSNDSIIEARHQESLKNFPHVKVDGDEFVILSLKRHWIGLFGVILTTFILFVVLVSAWILVCFTPNPFKIPQHMKDSLSLIFAPLSVLILVAGYIGYSTYNANKFFITNERVIQWIVGGLLDRKSQTINLESIEDISFSQSGLLQHIFNFGTVRMSTVGDESTYTFHLAKFPAKTAEILGEVAEYARENQPIPEELMNEARELNAK